MKSKKVILLPIFLVVFIDNFGYSLIYSILCPMLLVPEYGMMSASTSDCIKNGMLALTFGIFPLAQFFSAPIIGELADRFGRKKAFYISLLGLTLGFIFSAWAIFIKSIWFMFFSRLVTGAFAGNISICMATIADISPDEKQRGKNFSMVTALFGMSWVFAMLIGGYFGNPNVLGNNGPGYIFLFTAFLSFCGFLAIIFFYKETFIPKVKTPFSLSQGITDIKKAITLKTTRVYFLVYAFWSIGWVMSVQWFPVYSLAVYKETVFKFTSWYLMNGIAWTIGAFFAEYFLFSRLKIMTIAILGFSCMTISIFLMQLMSIYFLFGLFFAIASFFSVFAMSSSLTLISLHAKPEVQGKVMGLSQSTQSISYVLVSLFAFLISLYTISVLFFIASFICLSATIILACKCIKERKGASQ